MKRVLVVDDEEFIRTALSDKLKQAGLESLTASDGEEAVQVALKEHPDLIVLDIAMPKMDGMEVMKKLRQDDWGKDVAIILLTQLEPDDKILQEIVEGSPTYYLIKANFRLEAVVEKVKERLGI